MKKRGKIVSFNKWGYFFLIPFFAVYCFFQLIPLVMTIYYSFFENYMQGMTQIGPRFIGIENYITLFSKGDLVRYALNTFIMWIIGFIPQILVSLLLGAWFSDTRLRLKAAGFYKVVIYLPNLIMASAFSMLFFALFSETGPINALLVNTLHVINKPFIFFQNVLATRTLVGFMNFLMWFGNTTILLMAGMLGIDPSLYEAAEVDGATPTQVFWRITLPLLRPILVFVVITSLIGGLQMFDVPQILTNGHGSPANSAMTLIMWLNRHISTSKNFGMGGALSVVLFIITGALSMVVYKISTGKEE